MFLLLTTTSIGIAQVAMSFLTDSTWPAPILSIFKAWRAQADNFQDRYYGPYNTLLGYCFVSDDFRFYTAALDPPGGVFRTGATSIVFFTVYTRREHKPVLFMEVKDDAWAENAELRNRADEEMREWYSLILDKSATPHLWGLSMLGTSMRVYRGDKETGVVEPERILAPGEERALSPTFLADEWNLDILSQEGFNKMKEIVVDILTDWGCLNNRSALARPPPMY